MSESQSLDDIIIRYDNMRTTYELQYRRGETNNSHLDADLQHAKDVRNQSLIEWSNARTRKVIGKKLGEDDGWDWFFGDEARCCPGDDFAYFGNHLRAKQLAALNKLDKTEGEK